MANFDLPSNEHEMESYFKNYCNVITSSKNASVSTDGNYLKDRRKKSYNKLICPFSYYMKRPMRFACE